MREDDGVVLTGTINALVLEKLQSLLHWLVNFTK
jgi:hypothetical protein